MSLELSSLVSSRVKQIMITCDRLLLIDYLANFHPLIFFFINNRNHKHFTYNSLSNNFLTNRNDHKYNFYSNNNNASMPKVTSMLWFCNTLGY